jgi:hypothetical protein
MHSRNYMPAARPSVTTMFACPACRTLLNVHVDAPVTTFPAGTVISVMYDESVPIESTDTESDAEQLTAPAIVLGERRGGQLSVAWLLPVADIRLKGGERRPVRWQGRGPTTHVLDTKRLVVDAADAFLYPDVVGLVIDPAVVYNSTTSELVPGMTYASFLASNLEHAPA